MRAHRPRSLNQARVRRHMRRGESYDPSASRAPGWAIGLGVGMSLIVLGAAGVFVFGRLRDLETQEREAREKPLRSKAALADMRRYFDERRGDDQIDAVRNYLESRRAELEPAELFGLEDMLAALKVRREQAGHRRKLDEALAYVRSHRDIPENVDEVNRKAAELEEMLKDLDDEHAADVKTEIFMARGRSALALARAQIAKADKLAQEHPREFSAVSAAYEKADDDLARVIVATRMPEFPELRRDIARRLDGIGDKWAEDPRAFEAIEARDLLVPREFKPLAGDTLAPWQASPAARFSFEGNVLRIRGLKPERAPDPTKEGARPEERAGIVFWSPTPTTAIRHYDLKVRVTIVKKGFTLVARQSSGYLRHLFGFETAEAEGRGESDGFHPVEGHSYELFERVIGRKVRVEIACLDPDESVVLPVEDQTGAREGGVGFQVRDGAEIEVQRLEIRILR
ncbi:MAG TPA: hypothetical protein VKE69_05135 [Planctomycetota bacterium]|nr:hypothetical protein [Planctomycetota bacterium]